MQETSSKKRSLLYVGNNLEVLDVLRQHLNQINLIHQDNGLKAIDYLRRIDKVDAILSDAYLPGISGDELAVHIKERLGMWNTPSQIDGGQNHSEKNVSGQWLPFPERF